MGALSIWHILILGIVAVLLFGGGGKISDLMSDVGKGVRSFREGLNEPGKTTDTPDRRAEISATPSVPARQNEAAGDASPSDKT